MNEQAQSALQEPASYRQLSFLLRLWQAGGAGTVNWQASLEIPGTGRRIGFSNLEGLFAYLMDIAEGGKANALATDQSES